MPRSKKDSRPSDEEILDLIEAFKYFDKTTTALNQAYRRLEVRIDELRSELEEKNRLLTGSVAEISRVKNFLSKILENLSSGVVVIDVAGNITIFNKVAGEITGYNPEDAVGKPYYQIMGKPDKTEHDPLKIMQTEKGIYKRERTIKTGQGGEKPIVFSTSVVMDENEEIFGAVEIFEDLSEVKKLEEEVHRHRTLVELGEMAASIAHEIRNPLGGIGGFATLLERDLEGDPVKQKLVRRIIEGINSLHKITTDVLMYTRKIEPSFEPVNIKEVVQEAVTLVRMELEESEIEIEYNHPAENIDTEIDRELVMRLLLNLLKNAANSMGDRGKLTVNLSWKLMHNKCVLEVIDTGAGIGQDDRSKIFNPFFTTDPSGTGLGLPIVRRVVELHNGRVEVDSEVGQGTKFTIDLPILQNKSA